MLHLADRVLKLVADVTVGSAIVLVHMALADRHARRRNHDRQLAAYKNGGDARAVVELLAAETIGGTSAVRQSAG